MADERLRELIKAVLASEYALRVLREVVTERPDLHANLRRALRDVPTGRTNGASRTNGLKAQSDEARAKMRAAWVRRRDEKAAKLASLSFVLGSRDPMMEDRYDRRGVCWYRAPADEWGGLAMSAPGYRLVVSGVQVPTALHLYTCLRASDHPSVQREVLARVKPSYAVGRSIGYVHAEWTSVALEAMRWCLQMKLAQHYERFSLLLLRTDAKDIVQIGSDDAEVWAGCGLQEKDKNALVGRNVVGKLLMELRDQLQSGGNAPLEGAVPFPVPGFRLLECDLS